MPPKALLPKAKPKVDPSPPPLKASATGEDPGAASRRSRLRLGPRLNLGTSTSKTVSLDKYNYLVAKFNQLQEALTKVGKCKEHHKNESVSLSGSLTDNIDALKEANQIIQDLKKEANDLAESIGLDKDTILAEARQDDRNSFEMTSRANVQPFSAEHNSNAWVWFDNLL